MTLSDQISEYEADLKNLKLAIKEDDQAAIEEFDRLVSRKFEAIIEVNPKSTDDLRAQFSFLLAHLLPEHERSNLQKRVTLKLTYLFDQLVGQKKVA